MNTLTEGQEDRAGGEKIDHIVDRSGPSTVLLPRGTCVMLGGNSI